MNIFKNPAKENRQLIVNTLELNTSNYGIYLNGHYFARYNPETLNLEAIPFSIPLEHHKVAAKVAAIMLATNMFNVSIEQVQNWCYLVENFINKFSPVIHVVGEKGQKTAVLFTIQKNGTNHKKYLDMKLQELEETLGFKYKSHYVDYMDGVVRVWNVADQLSATFPIEFIESRV